MPTLTWLVRSHSSRPVGILLALLVALVSSLGSAAAAPVYPNSMAATGDSITRAFDSTSFLADTPANSWSTGTNTTVNSLYLRIRAKNSAINGRNSNVAKTGAVMNDLAGQIDTVNTLGVDYVTILIGANDACTKTEAAMTPVATFRGQFQAAMDKLATGSPNARVYVLSIPNVYLLWQLFKGNSSARFIWSFAGICQSLLANPTSTQQADIDRRNRVKQRVIDFNAQLQQVCALYTQCRFDNNAVFNTSYVASDVSTKDYFHPSVSGQAKLATVAWNASGLAA